MGTRLEIEGLTVRFGGVTAVDDLGFTVEPGSLTGLIGPNGAGKTTTIDALTGVVPAAGVVRFDGRDLAGLPPHRRATHGLVRTWQSLELFADLTVRENLRVAADRPRWWSPLADVVRPRRHSAAAPPGVDRALALLDLDDVADERPDHLPLGRRKLVGVARALAASPSLLLLDEPAAGLDTGESQAFGRLLRRVVNDGVTVLLVDHDMGLVMGVSDVVHVMEFGRLIASGPAEVVRADERVVAAYLGAAGAGVAGAGAGAGAGSGAGAGAGAGAAGVPS